MTTWIEDIESEDLGESVWDTEDFGAADSEGDSESTRSDAARRARARRLALLRRRAAMSQQPLRRTVVRPGTPRDTVAAIRQLDLQTKVGNDSLRESLAQANRRANRATYVTVASLAVEQALDTFGDDLDEHDLVRAGLRSAPLLLLSPERKRAGFEGFVLDPRVIGLAGVAGIVAAGRFHHRSNDVQIELLDSSVKMGTAGTLKAMVVDKNGRMLAEQPTFSSGDPTKLAVSPNGDYLPQGTGSLFVIATVGGRTYPLVVNVDAADAGATPSSEARIEILDRSVKMGVNGTLKAIAVDRNGQTLAEQPTFTSADTSILTVSPNGDYVPNGKGPVFVSASVPGHTYSFVVTVS